MTALVLLAVACEQGPPEKVGSQPWATADWSDSAAQDASPTQDSATDSAADSATDSATDSVPDVESCEDACADTSTSAGWARCYSCQCKAAMDGWLPGPDELQCANGAEIVIYHTDDDGVLSVVDSDVSTCANPARLNQTCAPGGRLGQLTHGDVTVKWICRRNVYSARAADDPSVPYDDVGAILYNMRTGASCWVDDTGAGINDDNWPAMDLTTEDADVAAWIRYFYAADGTGCSSCHDNDPFIYTPFLQSVGWVTGDYTWGGFSRVGLDGSRTLVEGLHLVSPEADACTSCHRITSTQTCSSWAADSMGTYKGSGTQPSLLVALGDTTSPLWEINTWMPVADPFPDPDEWEATYGEARDAIQACCAQPGVETDACTWEPNF